MVKTSSSHVSEPYVCVSLFHDPASMEKNHFFLIDHQIANEAEDVRFLQVPPQHASKSAPDSANPVWNDACTLKSTHPGISSIVQLKKQQKLASLNESVPPIPLAGQTVLMLATVHDSNAQNGDSFCGRVVIPQVRVGQPVDQWFMLHGHDGSQMKDAKGDDAAIRLRFAYGAVKDPNPELPSGWEKKTDEASGKVFYVNHVLKTFSWVPPPRPVSQTQPISLDGPVLEALDQSSVGNPDEEFSSTHPEKTAPVASPTADRSAPSPASAIEGGDETKVCISIKQGKDLPRMDHLSLSNAYVCTSIIGNADKADEASLARLQHDVSKNKLRAGLRSTLLKFYPMHRSKVVNRSLNPKWNEDVEFKDGYRSLEVIEKLQQKGAPKEGQVEPLQNTPIAVLITVLHQVPEAEDTPIGKIVIPLLKPGEERDEWVCLVSNDGAPQVGGMNDKPSQLQIHIKYQVKGSETRIAPEQEQEMIKLQEAERLRQLQEQESAESERLRRMEEDQRRRQEQEEEMRQLARQQHETKMSEAHKVAEAALQKQALEQEQKTHDELTRIATETKLAREAQEHQWRREEQDRRENQVALVEQRNLQVQAEEGTPDVTQQRQSPLTFADGPVDMELKLGLDFVVAGPQGSPTRASFEQNLIRDLSNASGLSPVSFRVKRMSPGSVIVDVEIHRDPTGRGPQPHDVAMDLEQQAMDPRSALRNGILTSYTMAIAFPSLPKADVPIAPRSPPKYPRQVPTSKVYVPQPSMHQAKLFISVIQAKHLPQTDGNDGSYAFCEVALEADGRHIVVATTGAVASSYNPKWDEHFVTGIDADQIANSEVNLSLIDWNFTRQNRVLGRMRKLRLSDLVKQGSTKSWFDIFTEDGLPLTSPNGQASICVGLEYGAPFVQASVLSTESLVASPTALKHRETGAQEALPETSLYSGDTCVWVKDPVPLTTCHNHEMFMGSAEGHSRIGEPRHDWQGSPKSKSMAANTIPPMPPYSPNRSLSSAVANPHSALAAQALPPRPVLPLSYFPSDPKLQEAGVGIILTIGPRSEYFVDTLVEVRFGRINMCT